MKHLLTAIACCLAVAGSAQTEWPWNPDYDSDQIIGMTDFLPFLGIFGDEFILEMPEDAPYTLALGYLGDYDYVHCKAECRKRNGRLPFTYEVAMFEEDLDSLLTRPPVEGGTYFAIDPRIFHFLPQENISTDDRYYATVYHSEYIPTSAVLQGDTLNKIRYNEYSSNNNSSIYKAGTCLCIGVIPNE